MATEIKHACGKAFKSAEGLAFHARWCGGVKASKRAKAAAKPAKPVKVGKFVSEPTQAWREAYAAERAGGSAHRRAVGRANRATGSMVSWFVKLAEAGPSPATAQPTHERSASRKAQVHTGGVDLATMPADWMLDRNGRPLAGAALAAKLAAMPKLVVTPAQAALPTHGHDLGERVDALEAGLLALASATASSQDSLTAKLDEILARMSVVA